MPTFTPVSLLSWGNLSSALLNKQLMKGTHNNNSEAAISVIVDIQVRTCDADMANITRFVRKLWGVILASLPPNLLVSLRAALQMLDLFHLETCFVDPRRWHQPAGTATSFVDPRLRTALAREMLQSESEAPRHCLRLGALPVATPRPRRRHGKAIVCWFLPPSKFRQPKDHVYDSIWNARCWGRGLVLLT